MKRKTLIPCILLPVLAACGRVEPDGDNRWTPLQLPVQIAARLQEDGTKAPVDAFADGDKIGVFGFYHDDSTWATDPSNVPDYMYNQCMTFGEGAWTYSPVKYWPNETGAGAVSEGVDKLSFWGYHPWNGSGISFPAYSNTSTGIPATIGFTQSTTAGATQVDLMVSDLVKDQTKPALDGTVTLPFRHILSRVDFAVKKADGFSGTVALHSITVGTLNASGTWTTAETATAGSWGGPPGTPRNFTVFTEGSPASPLTVTTAAQAAGTILPIPQSLAGVIVTVVYSIDGTRQDPSTFYVSQAHDPALEAWECGVRYTYTLTMKGSFIEFSATVAPWGTEEHGYIAL